MKTYYWAEKYNWGDQLSPIILEHFSNIEVQWAPPEEAELTSTGSCLDLLPEKDWTGTVVGSGLLYERTNLDFTKANVIGLRGPLTMMHCELAPNVTPVMGDPGLLVPDLVTIERGKYDLGVIPHITDDQLLSKFAYLNPLFIDPNQPVLDIVQQIGSCNRIVTSSLHGMVTADAFHIPRRIEQFAAMNDYWQGGDFKWRDYNASVGVPITWGLMQQVDRGTIEAMQMNLFEMFYKLEGTLSV